MKKILLLTGLVIAMVATTRGQTATFSYTYMDQGYSSGEAASPMLLEFTTRADGYCINDYGGDGCVPLPLRGMTIVNPLNGAYRGFIKDAIISEAKFPNGYQLKRVYYGDEDRYVAVKPSQLDNPGDDEAVYVYVYSPYKKNALVSKLNFSSGGSGYSYSNFYSSTKAYGTTKEARSCIEGSYVFKVTDWVHPAFEGQIETVTDPDRTVMKLNGGVNVFIHGIERSGGTYTSYNRVYPVTVYPVKPEFRTSFPAEICVGASIDLSAWVDMKGENFRGRFVVMQPTGAGAIIESDGKTLNLKNYNFTSNTVVKLKFYPYYTPGFPYDPYMTVEFTVKPSTAVSDLGEILVCSGGGDVTLNRFEPEGGTYGGSYVTAAGLLRVSQAVAANLYTVPVTYTYTSANGCKTVATGTQAITKAPVLTFALPAQVCSSTAVEMAGLVSPAGGTFSGAGVTGSTFSPTSAGIGTHALTYNVGGTCPASLSKSIAVASLAPETITISTIPKQCRDGGTIDLTGYVNYPGGYFSGPGVTGNAFNPLGASVGMNTITYTVGSGACLKVATKSIEVVAAVSVSFGVFPNICTVKPINLKSYVSVSGGTFSGPGVMGDVFYPEAAGVGSHTIFYSVSSGSCSGTSSAIIKVTDLLPDNVYFSTVSDYCKEDLNTFVDLRDYLKNHAGGTFSGKGVEGNYFYPSRANVGSNTIYYTYGSGTCSKTVSKEIFVYNNPAPQFFAIPDVCQKVVIDLAKYVYPTGGTFTGMGIESGHFFNSEKAGVGSFPITYEYNDGYCTKSVTRNIVVGGFLPEGLTFDFIPEACKNSAAINLRDYTNTLEGVFSGTGVVGDYFNPSQGITGINAVKLSITKGSCSVERNQKISLLPTPTVTFQPISDICSSADVYLPNYVYPWGGTFSGIGVHDGIFSPKESGLGERNIFYEVKNAAGCSATVAQTVAVNGLIPDSLKFSALGEVCLGSDPVDLTKFVNVQGGTFSGTGVVGSYFNPGSVSAGAHNITYTFTNGACTKAYVQPIAVKAGPSITFTDPGAVCFQGNVDLKGFVFPKTGVFSGPAVTADGIFNPTAAGLGDKVIFYQVSENGCTNVAQRVVKVNGLINPAAAFSAVDNVCKDGSAVNLRVHLSGTTGGTFSGKGVVGDYFNPSQADVGANLVTYTMTNGACSKVLTQTVIVEDGPVVNFSAAPTVCGTAPIDLSSYVSAAGGTFSGPGVSGTTFNPLSAGVGIHKIFYTATSATGCKTTVTRDIQVSALLPSSVTISDIPVQCQTGGAVNLLPFVSYAGGTFSGSGVVDEYLNPSTAGIGAVEVTYTVSKNGCTLIAKKSVVVQSAPTVTMQAIPASCSDKAIDLSKLVLPAGGTFSGSGVDGTFFKPGLAGIGTSYVNYSVSSANGCVTTITKPAEVSGLISDTIYFKALPEVCRENNPVNLRAFTNSVDGVFSGPGVVGDYFTPSQGQAGANSIKLTVSSGACSKVFTQPVVVSAGTAVTFSEIPASCSDKAIDLSKLVYPTGGTFSGNGVDGTQFKPSLAGVGSAVIYYTVKTSASCNSTVSKVATVSGLLPDTAAFNTVMILCSTGEPVDLRDYVNVQGGTFNGPGVVGSLFYPNAAKVGGNEVSYAISSGSCTKTLKQTVSVVESGSAYFNAVPSVCYNLPVELAPYVYPSGGTFSGPGVVGNRFDPSVAGVGKHQLLYRVNTGTCTTLLKQEVQVKSLQTIEQDITVGKIPQLCLNSPKVDLRAYVAPAEGYFSGKGIEGNFFTPSLAGIGLTSIRYTIGTGECVLFKDFSINVVGNGDVTISAIPTMCGKDVDLAQYVTPATGIFSGQHLSGSTFNGSAAGAGTFTISYTVASSEGCTVVFPLQVTNRPIPDVDFMVDEQSVQEGGTIQFQPIPDKLDGYTLRWDFGDGAYSLEKEPWHYYYPNNATGRFSVGLKVSAENGCSTDQKKVDFIEVVGNGQRSIKQLYAGGKLIYEVKELEEEGAYPNPFSNTITITGAEGKLVVMLDELGREVTSGRDLREINTTSLKPGVYFLKIVGKETRTVKMIKVQ